MFKKASDNVHYLERTASHATKGRANGLVEHRRLDETDFYSDAANMGRWIRLKVLKEERKPCNIAYWGIIGLLKTCDDADRRGLTSTLKVVRKKLRSLNLEIAELATVTKKPVGKVRRHIFSSPAERKAHYREIARKMRKDRHLTK